VKLLNDFFNGCSRKINVPVIQGLDPDDFDLRREGCLMGAGGRNGDVKLVAE